jgi:hypothetical protein
MRLGEAGPADRQCEAAENQHGATQQGFAAGVQEARLLHPDWEGGGDDFLSLANKAARGGRSPIECDEIKAAATAYD